MQSRKEQQYSHYNNTAITTIQLLQNIVSSRRFQSKWTVNVTQNFSCQHPCFCSVKYQSWSHLITKKSATRHGRTSRCLFKSTELSHDTTDFREGDADDRVVSV